jgi:peroxiredoxin
VIEGSQGIEASNRSQQSCGNDASVVAIAIRSTQEPQMHRSILAFAACAIIAASGSSAGRAQALPGKAAPAFTATDSNGKAINLADFKGKIVVLEWTNHDCPYVRKHYGSGNMQALQAEAAGKDVVWLSVISSAPGMQGFVSGLEANKLSDMRKAKPSAVVLDPKGAIGKVYGATATPHMYVIAPDGTLAYAGAIDDKPTSNPADVPKARNYVKDALAAVAAGKPMSPAQTRSYGCSVKYQGS